MPAAGRGPVASPASTHSPAPAATRPPATDPALGLLDSSIDGHLAASLAVVVLLAALAAVLYVLWRRPYGLYIDEHLISRHRSRSAVEQAFQRYVAQVDDLNFVSRIDKEDFSHGWYRDASGEHRLDVRRKAVALARAY